MRKKLSAERGMSLVEATLILLILATLTAVIAPSMGDYLEDARQTKAKEDVEALGIGIVRLLRDTGFKGLKFTSGTGALTLANRAEILATADGVAPALAATVTTFTSANNLFSAGDLNWIFVGDNEDTFENQLVFNALATPYAVPATGSRARGWRGAYVNAPIGADPWGYKYYSNPAFLTVATDATGADEGKLVWSKDVVVLSAGPDNIIQTEVEGSAGGGSGASGSDDVVFVVQGNSR